MALSAKEREKIIEEEKLRYETRQALHTESCAKHPRRGRWLWWLAALLLAYAAYTYFACGRGACKHPGMIGCKSGHHMMGGHACCKDKGTAGCKYHGMILDANPDVEEGQPIPKKK